ncbi:MAG: polysaccharide export protein [Alphaproteobacteria bacterium]|nr:polysaccharide export protein [Alphaproteobacteria bacterium]
MGMCWRIPWAVVALIVILAPPLRAAEDSYRLNPGDRLEISIWKEPDMRREVVVLPDGTISYPLAGHMTVAGMTPAEVQDLIARRLVERNIYRNPSLHLAVIEASGNQIYVIGEVRRPGAFILNRQLDVMQALSLAGGLSEYADKGDIIILRRSDTNQTALKFDYSNVQSGKKLNTNVLLRSGDVIVVPD